VRLVKLSVERIVALMSSFYKKATKEKDVSAGTLCCKLEERLSLLLGLDHPTTSRLDVYQIEAQKQPSEHERIRDAIMRMANQQPPAQRAAINLISKLGPEEALRRLTGGDGNGAVFAPSADDENRTDPDEFSTPSKDVT
jgi:hypothetical protein